MSGVTESAVEAAALAWLETIGWWIAHGPAIAPGHAGGRRLNLQSTARGGLHPSFRKSAI